MPEGIEQLSREIEETVRAELDLRAAVSDLQIEQAIDRKILRKTEERYIPLKEKIELIEDASYLQYNRLSFLTKLYQIQFRKQKNLHFFEKRKLRATIYISSNVTC